MSLENKYINCLLVGALGDIIGFGNGKTEFNNNNTIIKCDDDKEDCANFSNYNIWNFINNGGINQYNIKDLIVSDDTILHLATAKGLINVKDKSDDKIIDSIANSLTKDYKNDEIKDNRAYGEKTKKGLERLLRGKNWRKYEFSENAGGSGASMRNMILGVVFRKDRNKLIKLSIEASRITHNNSIGYLGGLCSALFASFACEKIELRIWPYELLKILESDIIKKHIKKISIKEDLSEHNKYLNLFITKIKDYIDFRFENKNFIQHANMLIPQRRTLVYYDRFSLDEKNFFPGSSGLDSIIIAYDCLIDSNEYFEKLVIYSMLHAGDSDTTGIIAGSLYGILYGTEFINEELLKNIDKKDEIIKVGKKLYNYYEK